MANSESAKSTLFYFSNLIFGKFRCGAASCSTVLQVNCQFSCAGIVGCDAAGFGNKGGIQIKMGAVCSAAMHLFGRRSRRTFGDQRVSLSWHKSSTDKTHKSIIYEESCGNYFFSFLSFYCSEII